MERKRRRKLSFGLLNQSVTLIAIVGTIEFYIDLESWIS